MTRSDLAEHLRQIVREMRHLSPENLAKLNKLDGDLIVDYFLNMPCGDCGKKLSEGLNVEQIIAESRNLAAFTKAHANDHTFTFIQFEWPSEIDVE